MKSQINILRSKVAKVAGKIYRQLSSSKRTRNLSANEKRSRAMKRAWGWAKKKLMTPKGMATLSLNNKVHKDYFRLKSSEGAILVKAIFVCVKTDIWEIKNIWCPKSIIKKNGGIPGWFLAEKTKEAQEERRENGCPFASSFQIELA